MAGRPVKVIHMAPLGTGGITKLTVTINGLLDPSVVQFDYLVFRDQHEFMEDRVRALGAKKQVVDTTGFRNPMTRFLGKFFGMRKLFKREQYDVVHVDASTPYDVMVALAAKLAGVPIIVMHSHNNSFKKGINIQDRIKTVLMSFFKQLMLCCCTDYFAISEQAARFMFPKSVLEDHRYRIIRNGIPADDYIFSAEDRTRERKLLNLADDHFVLGNVGRFVYQKNHDFMLEVFALLYAAHPESRLLLVGEGELQEQIRTAVREADLSDAVIFYGTTHDVPAVLSAMDGFIFPSRFEGLGIAAIEAQASGLPVYAADTIVDEVDVTDCFFRIHGWDAKQWAEEIWTLHTRQTADRCSRSEEIKAAGYDIRNVAEAMERFYVEKAEGVLNE